MRNQYFQLVFKEDKAYVHIYPALDGGEALNINELTSYLEKNGYSEYDLKLLSDALATEEEQEIFLGDWKGAEIRESMEIDVSMDKMKAFARFYPPSSGGKKMAPREIVGGLVFKRIKYGLDPVAIAKFIENPEYCKDIEVAHGLPVRHGLDAKITYFFNTNMNLQPKRNDDGSVDYKELNTISHVRSGELLARLTPEDRGDEGLNVYKEVLKPRNVKSAKLSYGKNIKLSEDGYEIYSEVTGHASLHNGKVFVSNTYEVPADVDNSTGNISYDGNVNIKGNVKTGFKVTATGNVIVEGVVENATIKAKGQIIVKQGIHGGGSGTLISDSNIMAKYIENSIVEAGGYVEAEIIMGSQVSAAGSVIVKGKKGLISGGEVHAKNSIEAENLGSTMGTATLLEVGIEPAKKQRYIDLTKHIREKTEELEDLKVIVENYTDLIKKGNHLPKDKLAYAQNMAAQLKQETADLEPIKEEVEEIHKEMLASDKSYVVVTQTAYAGVTISISDLSLNLKEERSHIKFHKAEGEIKADIY